MHLKVYISAVFVCATMTFGQFVRPFRAAPPNQQVIKFAFRGPLISPIFIQSKAPIAPSPLITRRFSHIVFNSNEPAAIKFIDLDQYKQIEGDSCHHESTRSPGRCTLSRDCPVALEMLRRKGIIPEICSYNVHEPVICCPIMPQIKPVDNVEVPTPGKTTPNAVANRLQEQTTHKRISALKCEEYRKSNSHTLKHLPLIGRPAVHEMQVPNCKPDSTSLIVGGVATTPGEFPHMAALGWLKEDKTISWKCGGSLISAYFVLTAAHCATMSKPPTIVRLGESNLNETSKLLHLSDYEIEEIFKHPDYTDKKYYHDIALLRLKRRVVFTELIRPACLWQGNDDANIKTVVATGWGQTEFMGNESPNLLKVSLNILDHNVCKPFFRRIRKLEEGIIEGQMCAGIMKGGRDTCQGDSGGPIQVIGSGCDYQIVGITSFGKFCAASKAPGIYTRISSYLDWIESVAWN